MFGKIILTILVTFVSLSWGTIFIVDGVPAVIAWWGIQAFSFIGVIIFIVSLIIIINKLVRRVKVHKSIFIIFIASIATAWPFAWFIGVGQMAYPVDVHSVTPAATVRLPVNQSVVVGWGGEALKTNYHAIAPNERWAYDLVLPSDESKSSNLHDYDIYGVEVVAPASGTVVSANGSEEDVKPGNDNYDSMTGNHVYLKLEDTGTYLVLAHLKKGSVKVKKGQYVTEGTVIAEIGNSGNSSEPHLHIHHQRQNPATTNMFLSEGLPLYFRDIDGPSMPKGGVHIKDGIEVPVGDVVSPTGT